MRNELWFRRLRGDLLPLNVFNYIYKSRNFIFLSVTAQINRVIYSEFSFDILNNPGVTFGIFKGLVRVLYHSIALKSF